MRWFIPHGITAPSHLPPGRISVAAGIDGQPGHAVNGAYIAADWQQAPDGWYYLDDRGNAADAMRLRGVPPGSAIEVAGRPWLVPHLLQPVAGGWQSALPRLFDGQTYIDPPEHAEIQSELRSYLHQAESGQAIDEPALAHLAAQILGIAYHISPVELIGLGWWREDLVGAVILAAVRGADDGQD